MKTHLPFLAACLLAAPVLAFESDGLVVVCDVPGLHSVQVESQVVAPLETALQGTPGLARCIGVAATARGCLALLASEGADLAKLRSAVAERLGRVKLPDGAVLSTRRLMEELDRLYVLSLRDNGSQSRATLSVLIDEVVRPWIQMVPGVAEVETWTGCTLEVRVDLDAERLAQCDVTACEVLAALRSAVGVASVADVEGAVVAQKGGTPVVVRDVATVSIGAVASGRHLLWSDGSERLGVLIRLQKEPRGDEALKKAVERIRAGKLPADVTLELFGPPGVDLRIATSDGTNQSRAPLEDLRSAQRDCASIEGAETIALGRIPGPEDGVFLEGDGHILVRCEHVEAALNGIKEAIAKQGLYLDDVRGNDRPEVTLQVFAPSPSLAQEVAEQAAERIRTVPGVACLCLVGTGYVTVDLPRFDVDRISASGAIEADVRCAFELAEYGVRLPLASPVEGARALRVQVHGGLVRSLAVRGKDGQSVPLDSLVLVEFSSVPAWVLREGGTLFSGIRARVTGDRATIEEEMKKAVEALELPDGVRLVWGADLGGL